MTHPTDDCFYPQPKSSQGLHTQESGDAGLSSNMEHKFSDNYNTLPEEGKGSSVMVIPKEEQDIVEHPCMTGEAVTHLSVLGRPAGSNADILSDVGRTRPKLHPVAVKEELLNLSTVAVVEKNNFPPRATPKGLLENGPAAETLNTSPGNTTIIEEELNIEVAGQDSCITGMALAPGGNPVERKGPPLVPEHVKNGNHPKRRAARSNWKLYLLTFALIVPASEGYAGAKPAGDQKYQCFTCMDEEKCPKLMTIYDQINDDSPLYSRNLTQPLPSCSVIYPLAPKSCTVCDFQASIIIICSQGVGKLEVEANGGLQIVNISPGCNYQQLHGSACTTLISRGVLFLILLRALVI
ncbi:uncharacterized protein LOC121185350 [Toxotes jaculatrix]|uniref:uncharacterized protein LOC121185350 n=1 Tax=Toxotes jaculatrix TaxID=941984 RepID=UPI001B3AE6C3|nr:uncharacterized protein LOC121185350 [Toxotes jaculatrix]XP_040899324.1 uncharacterized protein LOC121185350 [Toxotes jaculatrix]XP_040899325.1 uncharacterized protein LOC121185350 [Toxotes jaculatrix]XP_040899326.1 uncharacterized protein LOC121185350 [Toxotes jaculatrix]